MAPWTHAPLVVEASPGPLVSFLAERIIAHAERRVPNCSDLYALVLLSQHADK